MPIPEISHLQFLVLENLLDSERTGRELRAKLAEHGAQKSLPAFYQLMSRLEDGGMVTGRYELKSVDGQTFKERRYVITAAGHAEWESVRAFYVANLARHPGVILSSS